MVTPSTSSVSRLDNKDIAEFENEQQSFHSICQALQWKYLRIRIPICWKRLLHSRYMLANVVYLIYSIGILILNFHPHFNGKSPQISHINQYYIFLGILHLISASLYLWAWRDRSWFDIVIIPEYLNHLEGLLYLWSACWYSKQETFNDYYTLTIHQIELTAAIIEVFASFGWILSWYMTYTRTLGRGFTFDDPDTIAYLTTIISSIIYLIYNLRINLNPEEYGTNILYKYGDVLYFLGACYYILAAMRDENCFWFLPLAGQYGISPKDIQIESKEFPIYGKPSILITDLCKEHSHELDMNTFSVLQ